MLANNRKGNESNDCFLPASITDPILKMKIMKKLAVLVSLLIAGFVTAPFAQATPSAPYTWNVASGTSTWNTAGNWTGGIPASSAETSLTFNSGSSTYTSNDNLGGTLILNQMNFGGSGTSAVTIGTSGSGGNLNFETDSESDLPTIVDTSAANFTDSISATITNSLTVTNSGGATLTLSGTLTNNGGITFSGTGAHDLTDVISLNSSNTVSTTSGIALTGGVLLTGRNAQFTGSGAFNLSGGELASNEAVGVTPFTVTNALTISGTVQFGDSNHASVGASSVTLDDGSTLVAGSATSTSGAYVLQTGTSGVTFSANSGVTLTNNATISGSNNVIYGGSGNILLNAGTTNTYSGTTTVNSGVTVTLHSPNNNHVAISGSGLTINGGTVNQIAATNQIATTASLTLENGGAYSLSGLTANTNFQTVASLTIGSGSSDITDSLTFALPTTGGTTNAFLKDTGSLTFNSTSAVINVSGATVSGTYELLSVAGLGASSLADFTINPADVGYTLFAPVGGTTLDVIFAAPEPGTWALMLGGLTLLALVQRSRRKRNAPNTSTLS